MSSLHTKPHVFMALSGGVDSAVSAALLLEMGYRVTGVFMKNWSGDDFGIQTDCPWEEDQADAQAVCDHLGIPFRSFNFEKQYREQVVSYFFDEYKKGRTPNPDVMCNKEIKFKLFLERAREEGADFIATGHYARKIVVNAQIDGQQPENCILPHDVAQTDDNTLFALGTGFDTNKNQEYFLYRITQEQLAHTLFPVGTYTKPEVRALARKFDLPNAEKPDSQGICFIGEINVLQFLLANIDEKPGDIVDFETEEIVGRHKGVYFYTIGQRAKIPNQLEAYFYCGKDVDKNRMYVCHGHDHPQLFSQEVSFADPHAITPAQKTDMDHPLNHLLRKSLSAMIRYRQEPQPGVLRYDAQNGYVFVFDTPQRAVASGQSLVLFDTDCCLGGGIIEGEL